MFTYHHALMLFYCHFYLSVVLLTNECLSLQPPYMVHVKTSCLHILIFLLFIVLMISYLIFLTPLMLSEGAYFLAETTQQLQDNINTQMLLCSKQYMWNWEKPIFHLCLFLIKLFWKLVITIHWKEHLATSQLQFVNLYVWTCLKNLV